MKKMELNTEVFTIQNVSGPSNAWIFENKNKENISASIEDVDFIKGCKNGYYDPYDGMRIKASCELAGSKVLIKKVHLMG